MTLDQKLVFHCLRETFVNYGFTIFFFSFLHENEP